MEDFLIAYANFFYLGAVGTERFRVLKNPTAETQIERNRKRWGNRKSVCGRAVNSLVSPMTRPQRFPVPGDFVPHLHVLRPPPPTRITWHATFVSVPMTHHDRDCVPGQSSSKVLEITSAARVTSCPLFSSLIWWWDRRSGSWRPHHQALKENSVRQLVGNHKIPPWWDF